MDWVLHNYNDTEPLIISPDEEISIGHVAEKLSSIYDINELVFQSDMPLGQMRKPSDNSRLKSLIEFQFTPFDVGLEKTVSWFNDNYESARK